MFKKVIETSILLISFSGHVVMKDKSPKPSCFHNGQAGTRKLPIVYVDDAYIGDADRIFELEKNGQLDKCVAVPEIGEVFVVLAVKQSSDGFVLFLYQVAADPPTMILLRSQARRCYHSSTLLRRISKQDVPSMTQ